MRKSIGEMLDDPAEYFSWMHDDACRFGAVNAATELGLLEHIGPQPITPAEVAQRCGLEAEPVRRLVEYLTAEGVLATDGTGRYRSTQRSDYLKSIDFITMGGNWSRATALRLGDAIRAGKTAYELHFGLPVFEYFRANPELGAKFGRAMSFTTSLAEQYIFANHHFAPCKLAVDVGGSQGSMLLRLLKEQPDARGILFDLPETAEHARGPVSASPEGKRVELVGGSFFESVPAGGDLYILKQILHDWNDEECMTILRNIRSGITAGGKVAVIERLIPEEFRPHIGYDFDMVMMVWTTGRERRLSEYQEMLRAAGFTYARHTDNPRGMSVVEAVAA